MTLRDFIAANRDELISRCRTKVAQRSGTPPTQTEIDHGVPMFLSQLCEELGGGESKTSQISDSAKQYGRDLLLRQFSVSQVVHGYGDVCQSITDLAVERAAPITTDDFRTLNRCLDDAIACAVTEYAREDGAHRKGEAYELGTLVDTAITGFEALQAGTVGFGGNTAKVVERCLKAARAVLDRQRA